MILVTENIKFVSNISVSFCLSTVPIDDDLGLLLEGLFSDDDNDDDEIYMIDPPFPWPDILATCPYSYVTYDDRESVEVA